MELLDIALLVGSNRRESINAQLARALSRPRTCAVAIAGASPGAIGTAVGQQHLRQVLGVLGGLVLGGEAYVQFRPGLVDGFGAVTDESTRDFLQKYLARFGDLVRKLAAG